MDIEHRQPLRAAFEEYLAAHDEHLLPDDSFLSYDFSFVEGRKWQLLGSYLITEDLRELINKLHEWHRALLQWHAWNKVVSGKEEMLAWRLRSEFMHSLMHLCLTMLNTMRDVITFVATSCLHQVRLNTETSYADVLADPSKTDPNPKHLNRKQKEQRLQRLASPLEGCADFMKALRLINDQSYRDKTHNYRHLNSHTIGPRIALGRTRMVTRTVEPATKLERQADGTLLEALVADSYMVSYGFGGIEPLGLETAQLASLEQYKKSRDCFGLLITMLKLHCAKLPAHSDSQEIQVFFTDLACVGCC